MLDRFAGECELLGRLDHPCIVQFLGVCFEQGSPLPVLVMEYLHATLSTCLERYGVLPKEMSYAILHDVALGCVLPGRTFSTSNSSQPLRQQRHPLAINNASYFIISA